MRLFHALAAGSHNSTPMPGDVEGAVPAGSFGSWNPGPTTILTRHRSAAALGGVPVLPGNASGSPCLKAFTRTLFVLGSGLKAVFILSSHTSRESPPQPATVTSAPTALHRPKIPIHRRPVLTLTHALEPCIAFELLIMAVPSEMQYSSYSSTRVPDRSSERMALDWRLFKSGIDDLHYIALRQLKQREPRSNVPTE